MEQYRNNNPQAPLVPNPLYAQYSKLGGALLFFVVLWIIGVALSALSLLAQAPYFLETLSDAFAYGENLIGIEILCSLVFSVAYIVLLTCTIVMVFTKKRGFLTILCVLVFMALLLIIFEFIVAAVYPGILTAQDFAQGIVGTVRDILILVYFVRSVRVRTYMGSDEYLRSCPFTRWATPPRAIEPYMAGYVSPYAFGANVQPVQTGSPVNRPVQANPVPVQASPVQASQPILTTLPPAAWYPDPATPGYICWWDGQRWLLESRRPQ